MVNKKVMVVAVLILIVVVLAFLLNLSLDDNASKIEPPAVIDRDTNVNFEQTSTQVKRQANAKPNEKNTSEQFKDKQQSLLLFHEDPFVDYQIALTRLSNCIEYFKPIKSLGAFSISKKELTEKQQAVKKQFYAYCDSIKQEYANYFEKDLLTGLAFADSQLPDNLFENLHITKDSPTLQLSESEIKVIAQAGPYAIMNADKFIKTRYVEIVYPDLREVIGGESDAYLMKIVSYAQIKLGCDRGADCQSNTNVMFSFCQANEHYCDMSYQEFFDTRLTIGQRLDIGIAENYLQNFFGFDHGSD